MPTLEQKMINETFFRNVWGMINIGGFWMWQSEGHIYYKNTADNDIGYIMMAENRTQRRALTSILPPSFHKYIKNN